MNEINNEFGPIGEDELGTPVSLTIENNRIEELKILLREVNLYLGAAYSRPPQTPEVKNMLERVKNAIS